MSTRTRKNDHIRINLEEDVSFAGVTNGLERVRFVHQALPELDLEKIDTSTVLFGHRLSFPLLIASMTGGSTQAGAINRTLAEAAQHAGIGMGLGSGRVILEHPETAETFQVRQVAPDILLMANFGAVQLNYGYGVDACRRLVEMTEADGLYLHLNPLQEALQPEGDTRFGGLLGKIEAVCRGLTVPVVVKEVGWGLSVRTARMLIDAGVAALDVAGAGGTSWSQVELHRQEDPYAREVAASFRNWGIPTAEAIKTVRDVDATIPVIASGGLATGIDIGKCLALGANAATLAGVLLRAAAQSPEALQRRIETLHRQRRLTMFVPASPTVRALRDAALMDAIS